MELHDPYSRNVEKLLHSYAKKKKHTLKRTPIIPYQF